MHITRTTTKPTCGIRVGEPEILGQRCLDGGRCHHRCRESCFRKDGCVPLGASGLQDDWTIPGASSEPVPAPVAAEPTVTIPVALLADLTAGWRNRGSGRRAGEGKPWLDMCADEVDALVRAARGDV